MRFRQRKNAYLGSFTHESLLWRAEQLTKQLAVHRPKLETIILSSENSLAKTFTQLNKVLATRVLENRQRYNLDTYDKQAFTRSHHTQIRLQDQDFVLEVEYDANNPKELVFDAKNPTYLDNNVLRQYRQPTLGVEIRYENALLFN